MDFQFGVTRSPARILFGPGQRRALPRAVAGLGDKILVCTDAGLGDSDVLAEMRAGLIAAGHTVEVFAGTEPELPLDGITACVARYRAFAPDVVVGLGGGSCLDMAKLVSLLLSCPGAAEDFYGENKVLHAIRPVIALPTTAGTGSEVTPVAVLADPRREMKIGVSSPELIPHTAICDPELTLTCPPSLTAISGADALAHAIEAFAAIDRPPTDALAFERVFVGKNVLSDRNALGAITLIARHLPTAVKDGADLGARGALMLASTLAGLAFGSAGTSAAHALQYPVGARTHTAHGLGVGILLPTTMAFNLPAATAPYAAIARALGLTGGDDRALAEALIGFVRALFRTIGLPATLADIGFAKTDIDWAAERALTARRLVENNPRPIDHPAAAAMLRAALTGAPL